MGDAVAAFSDELGAFAGFVARNRQRIYIAAADSDDVPKLLVIGYKMGISRGDATCMNDLGALYYMGELVDQDYAKVAGALATAGEGTSTIPDSRENEILRFLAERPSITRKEVQTLLGVSQSTAGRLLNEMVGRGQIMALGGSRASRYELP